MSADTVTWTVPLSPSRERRATEVGKQIWLRSRETGDKDGGKAPQPMTESKTIHSIQARAAVEQHLGIPSGSLIRRGYGCTWTPNMNAHRVYVAPQHKGLIYNVIGPLSGHDRRTFELTGPVPDVVLKAVPDDGSKRPAWVWSVDDFEAAARCYRQGGPDR